MYSACVVQEASFVHQQIANMLTRYVHNSIWLSSDVTVIRLHPCPHSSIMSGEECEGEAIELPEIH